LVILYVIIGLAVITGNYLKINLNLI